MRCAGELQLALLQKGMLECLIIIGARICREVQLFPTHLEALLHPPLDDRSLTGVRDQLEPPTRLLKGGQGLLESSKHEQSKGTGTQGHLIASLDLKKGPGMLEHEIWFLQQAIQQA